MDSEVGVGVHWLLGFPLSLRILALGKSMVDQDWLRKGGAGYVRSKMKCEPRVPGRRAGATVVKGRQILRRVKRTLGVSSLSYFLACLPGGLCEAR